jgi:hypothetical protein
MAMLLCDIETGMGKWLLDVEEQALVGWDHMDETTEHIDKASGHTKWPSW